MIERAVLFCDAPKLRAEDLPAEVRGVPPSPHVPASPRRDLQAALAGEGGLKEHVKVAMSRLERELVEPRAPADERQRDARGAAAQDSRKGLQLKMKELGLREASGEKSD